MLLGLYKNFEELEDSLTMPELTEVLVANRRVEHDRRVFMAALKGVKMDSWESHSPPAGKKVKTFEDIKAKVASGGATEDANDILALQGFNAKQKGFGIGNGLGYDRVPDGENFSW